MPLPPAPPPSPSRHRIKQGGLVSGTGRLKHVNLSRRRQQHQLTPPPPTIPEQPTQPLTPREQFAKFYGFTLPPPLPVQEDPDNGYPYESEGGIIKSRDQPIPIANSASSSSTVSSSSASSSSSNDSYNPPSYRSTPPPPQFRRSSSYRASSSVPTYPCPLDHDELLAKFNDQFIHSRSQPSSSTSTPASPPSPTKRERSILPPSAEGKLVVPNVKLKVRCSSSASIDSPPSRRSTSSRKSPLSAPSCVSQFDSKEVFTSFTLKRPTFESMSIFTFFSLSILLLTNTFQLGLGLMTTYRLIPSCSFLQQRKRGSSNRSSMVKRRKSRSRSKSTKSPRNSFFLHQRSFYGELAFSIISRAISFPPFSTTE